MPLDEGFVNSVPEEIRNEKSFQEIAKTDAATFAKTYVESQRTLGRAIILPDEKEPEDKRTEKMNSVYEKLGRPKTHAEYDFKSVMPADGSDFDKDRVEHWSKVFHEAGLSTSQASRLMKAAFAESRGTLTTEAAVSSLSEGDEKHPGWGDKTEENIGVAKRALAQFDTDGELLSFLEQTRLGNHPTVLRFLNAIGSTVSEDKSPRSEGRAGTLDKSGAMAKIAEIQNNREHAYHDRKKAGHAEAVAEMTKLFEVVHGKATVATIGTH